MNPNRQKTRRRPLFRIQAEALESRQLLTGGAGNTFALSKATIPTAGGTVSVPFTIETGHFTLPRSGRLTLGLDVVADNGSTASPLITSVSSVSNHETVFSHPMPKSQTAQTALANASHAIYPTITLKARKGQPATATYQVTVAGANSTSGDILVGFFLPGDANGDGKVDKTDIAAIKADKGQSVSGTTYTFDADTNRDGKIDAADVVLAKKNLGAATTITPALTANLAPASDTGAADRITNVQTVQFTGQAAPGASINYSEINGLSPGGSTTADSGGNYSVSLPLGLGTNTFQVTSKDAFGQTIQGQIQPVTFTTDAVPQAAATSTTTTS